MPAPESPDLSIGAWLAAIASAIGALAYLVRLGQLLQELHGLTEDMKKFQTFAEQSVADRSAIHEDLADLRARHEALAERVREGR